MIRVDDRERRSGICEALTAVKIEYTVERLECADYIVDEMIFVERKTVDDFLDSLSTRRLFEQVSRLCAGRRRCMLIIEGAHLPGRPTVRGTLCALAAKWRLPVLRSTDVQGSAWYLAHIARQCRVSHLKNYVPSQCVQRPSLSAAQRMLLQIDGIGPHLADALLTQFGSVRAVLNASARELRSVEGVGRKLAQNITELV